MIEKVFLKDEQDNIIIVEVFKTNKGYGYFSTNGKKRKNIKNIELLKNNINNAFNNCCVIDSVNVPFRIQMNACINYCICKGYVKKDDLVDFSIDDVE